LRILWGENDPWDPIEQDRALDASYADELVTLQGAGHCPMDQMSMAVSVELLRFLKDHKF
jgi:hypothetical protein